MIDMSVSPNNKRIIIRTIVFTDSFLLDNNRNLLVACIFININIFMSLKRDTIF